MELNKDEALQIAQTYAAKVRAELDANAEVYLFGSAARGDMQTDSDIDVAVVSEVFTSDVISNRVQLMLLSSEINCDIEPHPVLQEDWLHITPFTREIMREGILV